MKNHIITGATGVIGMALINKCIEDNHPVTVIVNPDSNRLDRIPVHPLVTIIKCGIGEYSRLTTQIEKYKNEDLTNLLVSSSELDKYVKSLKETEYDTFYHLAWAGTFGDARNDMTLQNKNVDYALDAVRLAKALGCKCFIGVGSQAEYGRVEGMLSANTPTNPENGYGIAKLETSKRTRALCGELGIKHVWTRVLSIYGPYDGENTMVTSTVNKLLRGIKPSLTKGEQMWDYLYAADAANALYLLSAKGINGKIYPIGSGVARPLREYIEIIRDVINPNAELGFGEVPYSDKQVMYLCADISELTEDTDFTPQISFEEGIKRTIEYIQNINS